MTDCFKKYFQKREKALFARRSYEIEKRTRAKRLLLINVIAINKHALHF